MKTKRFLTSLIAALLIACLTACTHTTGSSSGGHKDKDNSDLFGDFFGGTSSPAQSDNIIADKLDTDAIMPERSIKSFQDIAPFLGDRLDSWQPTYRETEVTEASRTAINEYVALLVDEFNYEIVSQTRYDFSADGPVASDLADETWEVCLALSGIDTGRETAGRIDTSARCDIRLHCNRGTLTMVFSDLFHTEDFGFRSSGSKDNRFNEIYGKRVADAYLLKDGRYVNASDGVLSVEAGTLGEATILINGETIYHSPDAAIHNEAYVDYPCDDYEIEIYDFMEGVDSEKIEISVPKSLLGGEVYTLSYALNFRGDSPISVYARLADVGGVASWSYPNARSAVNALTFRVLQWNDTECIVYLSMDITYELEDMSVEVLAAMPAYGSSTETIFKEDEAIILKAGEKTELKYNPPYVFMPNYETYEWKIVSGQGISIAGMSDTCKIEAFAAGDVIIRCVYSYGEDEPDVLTGIPRNENHTKSKTYYIRIVD